MNNVIFIFKIFSNLNTKSDWIFFNFHISSFRITRRIKKRKRFIPAYTIKIQPKYLQFVFCLLTRSVKDSTT